MTTDNTSEQKDTRPKKYKCLGDVAYKLWTRFNGQCQSRGHLWTVEQTLGELQDDTDALDALGLVKKEAITNTGSGIGYFICRNRELVATITNALKLGVTGDAKVILEDALAKSTNRERLFCIVSPEQQSKFAKLEARYAALAASHAWMLERLKFVDGQYILSNPEPVWKEQIAIAEALQSSLHLKGAE